MMTRRTFHRNFKLALCREIASGTKRKAQTCREHSLSPGMLDRWVETYRALGESAFPNSGTRDPALTDACRVKELEALVGRLSLEMEFMRAALKKGDELQEKKRR